MTQKKKNNIIIGSLCAVVLLMVVGYAAFSSVLNIKGTSSIGSNWDVHISNILENNNIVGGASTAVDEKGEKKITGIGTLTASFETNLVSPGDSIEYTVEIYNAGTLDAKLDKITLTESNNPAIKFTASGLEEGSILKAGTTADLRVKVEYLDSVTSQPDSKVGTFTVTLDYSQANGGGVPSGPLAAETLIATTVSSGDGLYEDNTEPGRYIYKGTNPNNYITFNNEPWRIISVESDGTLKIMKNGNLGKMKFDSSGYRDYGSNGAGGTYCSANENYDGCNAWAPNSNFTNVRFSGTVDKDAELNTYLNGTYYNSLNSDSQNLISSHTWKVGPVFPELIGSTTDITELATQIQSENSITWNGKVGLLSASEAIKSNSNVATCGNYNLLYNNGETCKTTNYLSSLLGEDNKMWTITPDADRNAHLIYYADYGIGGNRATSGNQIVVPVVYINSNITLSGDGTTTNPYTINA